MTAFDACDVNRRDVAWQTVRGCALLINGRRHESHRLNPLGTAIWGVLADAAAPLTVESLYAALPNRAVALDDLLAFLRDLVVNHLVVLTETPPGPAPLAGSADAPVHPRHALRPRRRRVMDVAELAHEIEPTPHVLVRPVGHGFLVRFADGTLSVQTAEAALVWSQLGRGPRLFVEILDALCDELGVSYDEAEATLRPLLDMLEQRDAIRGLVRVAPPVEPRPASAVRMLGRLERMRLAPYTTIPPSLGARTVWHDVSGGLVERVAIVCQYGIRGLTPGVGAYAQQCIAALRPLDLDLVIIAGGGRHIGADRREGESVADLFRAHLPGVALWVEHHSTTTWENLKNSLEMLLARSIVPREISVIGEYARTEKLRASCWLARRRFLAFGDVEFRVVPVTRQRATWRDQRVIQALAGSALLVYESRVAGPLAISTPSFAPAAIGSGPVLREVSGPVEHVAIVCQYGINGLTPGVGPYVQRCIAELRHLNVDLVIVAGGGRHVDAEIREAESVAGLYRAHVPDAALWVENHSTTSWENVKNSLEMLLARSLAPRRVSVLGDRVRTEKLRVSCWLARRRFAAFRHADFRVVPVARQRATWRDRRAVQALAGSALLVRESRTTDSTAATPSS